MFLNAVPYLPVPYLIFHCLFFFSSTVLSPDVVSVFLSYLAVPYLNVYYLFFLSRCCICFTALSSSALSYLSRLFLSHRFIFRCCICVFLLIQQRLILTFTACFLLSRSCICFIVLSSSALSYLAPPSLPASHCFIFRCSVFSSLILCCLISLSLLRSLSQAFFFSRRISPISLCLPSPSYIIRYLFICPLIFCCFICLSLLGSIFIILPYIMYFLLPYLPFGGVTASTSLSSTAISIF